MSAAQQAHDELRHGQMSVPVTDTALAKSLLSCFPPTVTMSWLHLAGHQPAGSAFQVTLLEARHLPVWGFPWQSNPYCRLVLGEQTVHSRRDDDTSREGSHRAPVWNQEFQLLVESPSTQVGASNITHPDGPAHPCSTLPGPAYACATRSMQLLQNS